MEFLAALAPVFLLFDLVQIVVLERYIGVKVLKADLEPRDLPLPGWAALLWIIGTKVYLLWMIALLFEPRLWLPAATMLAATAAGLVLRRFAGLRWALVVLTFEVAIRAGMLFLVTRWWWDPAP
jgi:hypothetical protein